MPTGIQRGIAAILIALGMSAAVQAAPPNIILIFADDLGYGDVGFNGRTSWTTPNIDVLASQGTILRRFYTAAVVCAPSRAAMLTGKSTIHCGVSRNNDDLPAAQTTIAEVLKSKGYTTALFGKWHHGAPSEPGQPYVHPMDQGFDEFFGFTDATHAWEKYPRELWRGRERVPVQGYADDQFADHAVEFLERRPNSAPFFLYVPFTNAHFNVQAPPEEVARFAGKFPEADPAHPVNATYAAMVTRLDYNVGRIVATVDRLGLAENTLIVFTSDHGATFEAGNQGASSFHDSNAPLRGGKRTLYEGGIRVPTAVRWPQHIPAGRVDDRNMSTLDLLPTFAAAASNGQPTSIEGVDGHNRFSDWTTDPSLPGAPGFNNAPLFWEWRSEGSQQLAALDGDFKLVIVGNGRPELFDVRTDPAERRNLAATHPEVVKRMNQALQVWLKTEVLSRSKEISR